MLIRNNEFANCSTDSYITLANVTGLEVKDNHCLTGYSATQFVNFKWLGVPYTSAKRVFIEHAEIGATFTQLVGLNTDNNVNYTSGIIIRDRKDIGNNQALMSGFQAYDPTQSAWTGSWTESTDTPIEGIYTSLHITAPIVTRTLTLNTDSTWSVLKGRYLRLQGLTKGTGTTANGALVTVTVDGTQVLQVGPTGTSWVSLRNPTFLIPSTASQVVITISAVSTGTDMYLSKFNITDAAREPKDISMLKTAM